MQKRYTKKQIINIANDILEAFNGMLDYFQVSKSALTYRLEFLGLE